MSFDLGNTVGSLSKLVIRTNQKTKKKDTNINKEESKTFSVNVFLGKDKIIRFIPGIKNKFGVYVPIPEGM